MAYTRFSNTLYEKGEREVLDLNSKKPLILLVILFLPLLAVFTLNVPVAYASPKSLYMCAEHHQSLFEAWDIPPAGYPVTWQVTTTLTHSTDPAGIAIDGSSDTLFITSEFSAGVEMVDATTMTSIGVETTGPSDLAGIDVDDANDIVYTVKRSWYDLYVYDWDPVGLTLTPRNLAGSHPYALPGCSYAYGIALDVTTGILWVADAGSGVCRAYDTTTGIEDTTKSFTPSHDPIDIDIDKPRNLVYTVGGWYGSYLLSKFDLSTRTEISLNTGLTGCGVAVDEVTGYVYMTSLNGDDLTVWDCSSNDPSLWVMLQQTGDIGTPAGLCIPEEAAYNPLNLAKTGPATTNPGGTITYTITFDNLQNPTMPVNNVVLVDTLPPETTYVSNTGGGIYAAGTVTWNIGTLAAGAPTQTVTLTVTVNPGTTPGTTITNFVTIDSDETPPTTKHWDTLISITPIIPEVPWGTVMVSASMILALLAYIAVPRFRRRLI